MDTPDTHISVAVQAETLYLFNLLLLPGVSFLALLWLAHKHKNSTSELSRCHLRQTIIASIWAGVFLMIVSSLIIFFGGFQSPFTWMVLILYFLCCHSVFILFGVLGLARAMAKQTFVYPLIGSKRW
jgi:hypothetical protein